MKDIQEWWAWHKRNCRISKGALMVYVIPAILLLLGFTDPSRSHPNDLFWNVITSILAVIAAGIGIWWSQPVVRRGLAIVYLLAWAGQYIAYLMGKDVFKWVVACGVTCFWVTCYLCGQERIQQALRWRRDRE